MYNSITTALKLFKEVPDVGIIAYIDNTKKTVYLRVYKNFVQQLLELPEITFDEVKMLEKDISSFYLRNFLLRWYYKHYYDLGYTILFPKRLAIHMCTIRYNKRTNSYAVCLTGVSNPGKNNELLGITKDPLEAYEIKELYESCKAPFCWLNLNTRGAINNTKLVKDYSLKLLLGLS